MDCDKAGLAMMQYRERNIKPRKAVSLHRHLCKCSDCREYFLAYDAAFSDLEAEKGGETGEAAVLEMIKAPDGFTERVMATIRKQPAYRPLPQPEAGTPDLWLRIVCGFLVVVMGLGFAIMHNEEALTHVLNPRFAFLATSITAVSRFFSIMTEQINESATQIGTNFSAYITGIGPFLMIVLGIITTAFIIVGHKEKQQI